MNTPFLARLVSLLRAEDRSGAWESIPDAELVAPFIVTREQKRAMPMFDNPDPDILWRVELFYQAIACEAENRCGHQISPLVTIHHEGWGRVVLIAGRLVALDLRVRELARFGFETAEALEAKAESLIAETITAIARHPDIAKA